MAGAFAGMAGTIAGMRRFWSCCRRSILSCSRMCWGKAGSGAMAAGAARATTGAMGTGGAAGMAAGTGTGRSVWGKYFGNSMQGGYYR